MKAVIKKILAKVLFEFAGFIPTKLYLYLKFYIQMGYTLSLKNPKTFSEKIQWLKLHDRGNILYQRLVDKSSVKEYVSSILGDEFLIQTLGVFDAVSLIRYDDLPQQFVIKTTDGGGGNVFICKDKNATKFENVLLFFDRIKTANIYRYFREWPYKNIKRRYIVEPYLQSIDGTLYDYKFFCFDGKPMFFKVDFDRHIEHHANYYDRNCQLLLFGEEAFPPVYDKSFKFPSNIDEMFQVAEKLSSGFPFIRVDLYNVDGRIYFGELTFYPASGMGRFTSYESDLKLGALINLPC